MKHFSKSRVISSQKIFIKEDAGDNIIKWGLFLFSPFFSLVYSIRRINTFSSFLVFFFFALLFGFAFTVDDFRSATMIDAVSYRIAFETQRVDNWGQFLDSWRSYIVFLDPTQKDFYTVSLNYFVHSFSDNYHYMFMVAAIIFSFFQLNSLKYLVGGEKVRIDYLFLCLLLLFTWNQIFNINGMRFWTCAWVFVFFCFEYFYNNRKMALLLLVLLPIIHTAGFLMVFLVLLSIFTSKFSSFWIKLFWVSIFISGLSLVFLRSFSNLPGVFGLLTEAYSNQQYIESLSEGQNALSYLITFCKRAQIILMVFFLYINRNNLDTKYSQLLFCAIVLSTFSNFTMAIPSLGNRFVQLSFPLIAFLWYKNRTVLKAYNIVVYLLPIIWYFDIKRLINYYLEVVDISFFFSSPFEIISNSINYIY